MSSGVLFSLIIHSLTHFNEDVILNREVFADISVGDYIRIYDPERGRTRPSEQHHKSLVFRIKDSNFQPPQGTLQISLSKTVADPFNFKPFARVAVEKINADRAEIDFGEFGRDWLLGEPFLFLLDRT